MSDNLKVDSVVGSSNPLVGLPHREITKNKEHDSTEVAALSGKLKDMPDYEMVHKGTGACAGCPSPIGLRIVGKALGPNTVCVMTPSCTVASTGMMPKSCFDIPILNCAFASAAASASGISGAYDAMQDSGKLKGEKPTVITWIGDGGTYDIGFQGLSAAAERNEDIIYFCYNNEAYGNTGMQRSGATPRHAITTTTPGGKTENKKNMPIMMLEHECAYVATASVAYPQDFFKKVAKAKSIKGFRYIEMHAPCGPGWKIPWSETIDMGKRAVKTGAWALWESAGGKLTINSPTLQIAQGKVKPASLTEYIELQGRFDLVTRSPDKEKIIADMSEDIKKDLKRLLLFTQSL
ncbi:MAG: pyruvate synthase subunit beta [Oscillospiraceae bacterium]|jgi:pyruvate ferredoxin oxidoreductase beta subunit|nr:pyruvate synthase subunit beta [Oscillospiraceae bacterium]